MPGRQVGDGCDRIGRRRLVGLEVPAVTSAARYRRGGYRRRSARNLSLLAAYQTSDYFAQRVDAIGTDLQSFEQNPNTSVGQRMVYWATSWAVFTEHPLIGVGSGDFQAEYTRAKPEKWAMTPDSYNPHNQYLMTGVTTGLLGLAALAAIFAFAARGGDARSRTVLAGFAVVCLFESYLWRSNTALAFAVLVAVLTAPSRAGPGR